MSMAVRARAQVASPNPVPNLLLLRLSVFCWKETLRLQRTHHGLALHLLLRQQRKNGLFGRALSNHISFYSAYRQLNPVSRSESDKRDVSKKGCFSRNIPRGTCAMHLFTTTPSLSRDAIISAPRLREKFRRRLDPDPSLSFLGAPVVVEAELNHSSLSSTSSRKRVPSSKNFRKNKTFGSI